jgi:hypothetical protein
MVRTRTAALRPAALAPAATLLATGAVLVAVAVLVAACGGHAAEPVVVPSDVHLATDEPAQPLAATAVAAVTADAPPCAASGACPVGRDRAPDGADRLVAARTVMRYCALVDSGQFARAAELCTRRRLWSRRALAGVSRFRFRSARVYAAPDARTLVLKACVCVRAGRSRPFPDGLAVLFFTLGRAGTAVGGWLITAVSTSP